MASLYDRISKGKISVDEITASMERSTSAGGKYLKQLAKVWLAYMKEFPKEQYQLMK